MKAWDLFCKSLYRSFSEACLQKWVYSLVVLRFDARNLFLEVLNPLHLAWVEEHLKSPLSHFCNENGHPIKVHFLCKEAQTAPKKAPLSPFSPDRIDPDATFSTWIPSKENLLPFEIVSNIDASSYNPIFLYGPSQSGKTHLLQAAVVQAQKLGKKALFVRAETFTSHFIQAIRSSQMEPFRTLYRSVDLLAVDDVDSLANKAATQEEFFHTFNALHTEGKNLLLSATLPPQKWEGIEPRLVSRFEWGIALALEKVSIFPLLQKKNSLWKLPFSEEVLHALEEHLPHNALLALQALALRTKKPISPEQALSHLEDLLERERSLAWSVEKIVETVALLYQVEEQEILGKGQKQNIVLPRKVAMYLCRHKLSLPFQKIGKAFQRDHSTVMESVRYIEKLVAEKQITLPALH